MKAISKILIVITAVVMIGCGKTESTMKPSNLAPPPTKEEMKSMKGDTAPGP